MKFRLIFKNVYILKTHYGFMDVIFHIYSISKDQRDN